MDFQRVIEDYHNAANEFARGRSEPVKRTFSHGDDVILANPWGPAVLGWASVEPALDYAASNFRDGEVTSFDRLATYSSDDLVSFFEVETWRARVGARNEISTFHLRVTSVFRREEGDWKLVHRHADPISTPRPEGPLD